MRSEFKWDSLASLSVTNFKSKTLNSILDRAPKLRELALKNDLQKNNENNLVL